MKPSDIGGASFVGAALALARKPEDPAATALVLYSLAVRKAGAEPGSELR